MSKVNVVVFIVTLLTLVWNGYNTYYTNDEISMKDVEKLNANSEYIAGILDRSFISNDKLIGTVYEDLSGGFDPRLSTAIWIRMISHHLSNNSGGFDSNFKLPILWKYLIKQEEVDSNSICSEDSFDICRAGKIVTKGPLNYSLPEPLTRSIGKFYLLNRAPIPDRIILIGCGRDGNNLVIPTFPGLDLHNYIEDETIFTNGVSLNMELDKLYEIWNQNSPDNKSSISHNFEVTLNNSDFDFDSPLFDNNDNQDKFFHEANILDSKLGQHFDWRFFDKTNYSPYERKAILHGLSRAWLRLASSIGLKTWLAHGTLLGWYWNGMSLPWDEDMDVQITAQSLAYLASNYNNSLVIDLSNDGSSVNRGIRRYLLEVGPNFVDRTNGNGENNIDARFIDLESGFYVDITALALSTSIDEMKFNSSDAFNQVLDEHYLEQKLSNTISSQELIKKWESAKSWHKQQQDIYNCRNNHFYLLEDLNPMMITLFEGVQALVPRKFKEILEREYPKGLRNYQFAGHTYRPVLRLWVQYDICKKDKIGNECHHQETIMEAEATREMTLQHKQQVLSKFATIPYQDLASCRVDPWIIRRSQWLNQILIS